MFQLPCLYYQYAFWSQIFGVQARWYQELQESRRVWIRRARSPPRPVCSCMCSAPTRRFIRLSGRRRSPERSMLGKQELSPQTLGSGRVSGGYQCDTGISPLIGPPRSGIHASAPSWLKICVAACPWMRPCQPLSKQVGPRARGLELASRDSIPGVGARMRRRCRGRICQRRAGTTEFVLFFRKKTQRVFVRSAGGMLKIGYLLVLG